MTQRTSLVIECWNSMKQDGICERNLFGAGFKEQNSVLDSYYQAVGINAYTQIYTTIHFPDIHKYTNRFCYT